MVVTKETVARKIESYLHHESTLADLVGWAEDALMESDFEERETDRLREVISRLGVADVREFGLTWEDCEQILRTLGYSARVAITANH